MHRILTITLITLLIFAVVIPQTRAAVSSCSASVSPTTVTTDSSNEFVFTINNTDSVAIVWIDVRRPSGNFTITSISVSGWGESTDSTGTTLQFGTLSPGGTLNFSLFADTGGSEASSADWSVQVSDDSGGASPFSCSGTLGTAIEGGAPDTTAPTISDLTISEVSDTSVKITWTTDESADSVVEYGTTASYGSTKSDSTQTTSHLITLDSLSADTTYHYRVKSTDGSGNTAQTSDNTFVTAKQGTTVTVTETKVETKTETKTVTVTKLVEDTTLPGVFLTTDFSQVYSASPRITGSASDDVGVSSVEYSIDAGVNWLPVDKISDPNAKTTAFEFTAEGLLDGNYEVRVRAVDPTGNIAVSEAYTLVFDRLAPRVGVSLYSIGPQTLDSDVNGTSLALEGLDQKITLSAVGGPISIDLLVNRAGDASQIFSLTKNPETGLWSGTLSFAESGLYSIQVRSVDGAGNKTARLFNPVVVLPAGTVADANGPLPGVTVSLFYFELTTRRFVLWNGRPFSQENPQVTDERGNYRLIVPRGKYYLQVAKGGYEAQTSEIFTIGHTLAINSDFLLGKQTGFKIFSKATKLALKKPRLPEGRVGIGAKIGSELPFFVLQAQTPSGPAAIFSTSFRGKPTLITFLTTWSPVTSEQMAILSDLADKPSVAPHVIMIGESQSQVNIFQRKGRYSLAILADSDARLVELLKLQNVPTHIFLDRRGIVTAVKVGVLSERELIDNLLN